MDLNDSEKSVSSEETSVYGPARQVRTRVLDMAPVIRGAEYIDFDDLPVDPDLAEQTRRAPLGARVMSV